MCEDPMPYCKHTDGNIAISFLIYILYICLECSKHDTLKSSVITIACKLLFTASTKALEKKLLKHPLTSSRPRGR